MVNMEGYQGVPLPTHYEVCDRCRGEGKHVNPAIDGNGLTRDQIDEMGGDEFMEQYMGGMYDVTCEECKGLRVVKVVDEELLDREQREEYQSWVDYQNELSWERRMHERGVEW